MGLASEFSRAVFNDQGAQATWLPDTLVHVGHVIQRDPRTGAVRGIDPLTAFTNTVLPEVIDRKGSDVDIQRGASFAVSGNASAPVAEASVTFSEASSFVFSATGGTITEYPSQRALRDILLRLHRKGIWQESWELVTSVRRFKKHTLIIASDAKVTAKISFDVPTQVPSFAAVNVGASLAISSGTASKWQVKDGTPLYESLVVKVGFFGGADATSRTLDDSDPHTDARSRPDVLIKSPEAPELDLP